MVPHSEQQAGRDAPSKLTLRRAPRQAHLQVLGLQGAVVFGVETWGDRMLP